MKFVSFFADRKGFTLVEVLVVMVIMGLVITAVYGLFIDTKRTSVTSEEVADVQQNLRVGLETMVNDIRMAGFLIPSDDDPVATSSAALSDTAFLDLNLSTSSGIYARVTNADTDIAAEAATAITVDTDMADLFTTTDGLRIISPDTPDTAIDFPATRVTAVTSGSNSITIKPATDISVAQGDMFLLLKADDADEFPVKVRYRLVDDPASDDGNIQLLQRAVNPDSGNPYQTVAGNIESVTLSYLPDNTDIKAIRIRIVASTDVNKSGVFSGAKKRELMTVVKIRNGVGE